MSSGSVRFPPAQIPDENQPPASPNKARPLPKTPQQKGIASAKPLRPLPQPPSAAPSTSSKVTSAFQAAARTGSGRPLPTPPRPTSSAPPQRPPPPRPERSPLRGVPNGPINGAALSKAQKAQVYREALSIMSLLHKNNLVNISGELPHLEISGGKVSIAREKSQLLTKGKEQKALELEPHYFSPRQWVNLLSGKPLDVTPKDDMWALGIKLYYIEHDGKGPPFLDTLDALLEARDAGKMVDKELEDFLKAIDDFEKTPAQPGSADDLIKSMLTSQAYKRPTAEQATEKAKSL